MVWLQLCRCLAWQLTFFIDTTHELLYFPNPLLFFLVEKRVWILKRGTNQKVNKRRARMLRYLISFHFCVLYFKCTDTCQYSKLTGLHLCLWLYLMSVAKFLECTESSHMVGAYGFFVSSLKATSKRAFCPDACIDCPQIFSTLCVCLETHIR